MRASPLRGDNQALKVQYVANFNSQHFFLYITVVTGLVSLAGTNLITNPKPLVQIL